MVLLVFLHQNKILFPLENLIYNLTVPLQKIARSFAWKIVDFIDLIKSIDKLADENQRLSEENLHLVALNNALEETKRENENLRKELELRSSSDFKYITAFIVAKTSGEFHDHYLIDKGTKDGVEENMPVTLHGHLVGKIRQVYDHAAVVILITDKDFVLNAKILGTDVEGVIKGEKGLGITLSSLPQDVLIKKDDVIVTSATDPDIPGGLTIGKIDEVYSLPNEIFQSAQIKPYVNLKKLRIVSVISPK